MASISTRASLTRRALEGRAGGRVGGEVHAVSSSALDRFDHTLVVEARELGGVEAEEL